MPTGEIIGQCLARDRNREFLKFLHALEAQVSDDLGRFCLRTLETAERQKKIIKTSEPRHWERGFSHASVASMA